MIFPSLAYYSSLLDKVSINFATYCVMMEMFSFYLHHADLMGWCRVYFRVFILWAVILSLRHPRVWKGGDTSFSYSVTTWTLFVLFWLLAAKIEWNQCSQYGNLWRFGKLWKKVQAYQSTTALMYNLLCKSGMYKCQFDF